MDTSDLANRMKEYEKRNRYYLQKRTPVAIRVDGRSFHTFTKGFQRPFDDILIKTMQETAKYMCGNIQGAKIAYVQSDEITIILTDYDTLDTDCWFNYRTDKLCSISASMATMAFNKIFTEKVKDFIRLATTDFLSEPKDEAELAKVYVKAIQKGAMFDARCFNIPKEEVTNYFYWRQIDAVRNSIQMVGQANFSHKELHQKSCNMIQSMLLEQKEINWNDLPVPCKRGTCVIKNEVPTEGENPRTVWVIDKNIPEFKGEGRKYIDDLVYIGE